jgi:hypothetical protein
MSFLGLAGYYQRFVPQFSKMATLHKLLKKDATFEWREEQELAFQKTEAEINIATDFAVPGFLEGAV